MGKSSRAYRSAKRSKELARQKKQEKKRLRKFGLDKDPSQNEDLSESAEQTAGSEPAVPEKAEE